MVRLDKMKNILKNIFLVLCFSMSIFILVSCSSFDKWRMSGYKEELKRQEENTPEGRRKKRDKMLFPDRGGQKSTLNESPYNNSERAVLDRMREEDKKKSYERSRKIFGILTPKED